MTHHPNTILQALTSSNYEEISIEHNSSPESLEKFIELEERIGITTLPQDFKILLTNVGACSIEGKLWSIFMFRISEILENFNQLHANLFPGSLVIGSDGGGSYYFYDCTNYFKQGVHSIYSIDRGYIQEEEVLCVSQNLTDFIIRIGTEVE